MECEKILIELFMAAWLSIELLISCIPNVSEVEASL